MTRDKLEDMILTELYKAGSAGKLAGRILSAIDKEREGEMVLGEGMLTEEGGYSTDTLVPCIDGIQVDFVDVVGTKGALIFRPASQEDKK